jgi:hypothetical protein
MGFVILTGASGSGKAAISEAIASRYTESVDVYHFDQLGVPSPEEMVANYGSTEAWQLAKTHEWMVKITANRRTERHVPFEGQMRCSFVLEAAAAAGITEFILILVDCDDATLIRRLTLERLERRQPDLANPIMMSWARYLRIEAHQLHCTIPDTTLLSLEECVKQIWTQFTGQRRRRQWTAEEKARIVAESFEEGANISEVVRRHGVVRGLLTAWRRKSAIVRFQRAPRNLTAGKFRADKFLGHPGGDVVGP